MGIHNGGRRGHYCWGCQCNVSRYVKLRIAERKQQAASVPGDVQERLSRLESQLAEMSEEQRQLRSELEWQGKLLQQSSEE